VGDGVTGSPPDVVVDYSTLWTHVTLTDDLGAWAPSAADGMWRRSRQPYSALDVQRLAGKLAVLAEAVQRSQSFAGFFFCPELARGPQAVVRLNGLTYRDGATVDEVVEDFLFPAELQLLTPQVEHVAGPGLRRVRIRQRAYTDDTRSLSDFLSYVFPFDEAAWVLSVSFLDPLQLDRWLPELDALAAGVQLGSDPR
jgi:hypothetical protein